MFGYVNVYKPELKMKDYYKYKAYYCGLCRTLQDKHGRIGQMTLTYDMTFFVVLLTSLYESNIVKKQRRCAVHPIKKQDQLCNEITEYAADMNIAMTYHHFLDDWQDDRSVKGLAGAKFLKKDYKKICRKYPRQQQVIGKCLRQLQVYEKNGETNIDHVAGCFGELMGELLVYREDMWAETLRKVGFFLGKFIYIIDAYEDLQMDIKKGNYNPLIQIFERASYERDCKEMLTMMMAECTSEFEKLPCVIDIEILRNILYVGVWEKYDLIQKQNNLKVGTKE
ncbi:MAG: hypothetical protein CVU84_14350 [Firmicutes bacterium HGW-Firmicutes-1]|jgi:hypothetical protein|nr:MAG: hypothetical protein CVU84_14350 [Firmicutes bacterium HGW-Firmicutes-1]